MRPKGGHCDMSDDDLGWLQWDGPESRYVDPVSY